MPRSSNCLFERARQTTILLKKNFIVLFRNPGATLIQLLVPIFFVFLLFLLDQAVRFNAVNDPDAPRIVNSTSTAIGLIPICVLQPLQPACWSFAYEPANDPVVAQIIERIRKNNNLTNSDIIGFRTEAEVHRHLLEKANSTFGAYHIRINYGCDENIYLPASLSDECNANKSRSSSDVIGIRYAVQYNSSSIRWRGNTLDTKFYIQLPMIKEFDRAIFELFGATANVSRYNVDIRRFPKPEVLTFSAVSSAAPFLFFAAMMFNFVIQVGAVVQEKELKLRESMRVMGLLDSSYWLSWSLVNALMALVASLLLCGAGAAFQFRFFLMNDFLTYFILFLLFGLSMVPLSFVVSTLLDTSSTATTLGFVVFLVGSLVQFFSPTIYISDGPLPAKVILSFFPFIIFGKGLTDLADATSSDASVGIRFGDIATHTASWPLAQIYYWLAIDICVYTFLYIVLDNVLYMNRPIYFFLLPSYWRGPSKARRKLAHPSGLVESDFADVDVAAEFTAIQKGTVNPSNCGVVIQDLQKTYTKNKFGCIPDPKATFKAVSSVSLSIEQGTLLCLLGHNGAGKTTTIGMLTGLLPSSGGDAFIFGHSIVDDMEEIRQVMGVCPQHDILWNNLTAREHLELFARLKQLPGDVDAEIEARLRDVSLLGVADVPAGNYSGGMKRRLSVAVALIGNPKIVFLDEPTTGMDPVSRREVWNLIESGKRDRVTLLCTHSMEEADILGDKIAIMKGGLLASIGTSLRMKSKYGTGYTVSFVTDGDPKKLRKLKSFVENEFRVDDSQVDVVQTQNLRRRNRGEAAAPSDDDDLRERVGQPQPIARIQEISHIDGVVSYKFPQQYESELSHFFKAVERRQGELGVRDFQLSMTTLEEVFLAVADEEHAPVDDEAAKLRKMQDAGKAWRKKRNILLGVAGILTLLAVAALLLGFLIKPAPPPPASAQRSAEPSSFDPLTPLVSATLFPVPALVGDVSATSVMLNLRTTASLIDILIFRNKSGEWEHLSTVSGLSSTPSCAGCISYCKTELTGLQADTPYSIYALDAASKLRSYVTRFRTAPAPQASRKIVFGISGSFGRTNPEWGMLKNATAEKLDFFILGGNTIYAPVGAAAANYSAAWIEALSTENLFYLTSSTSLIATYADGEVGDVTWASVSMNPYFPFQLAAANEQFNQTIPTKLAPDANARPAGVSKHFRSLSFGAVLDIFVLDTRTERNLTHLISADQMHWIKQGLKASKAQFKLVVSSVPFSDTTSLGVVFPYASWYWYNSQRNELLNHIVDSNIAGVIFTSATARFGGYANVNGSNPNTVWGVQNVTEILAGPAGTSVHPSVVLNPLNALATQFKTTLLDTWNYARVEIDPVAEAVLIQFIDDNGAVLTEHTQHFIRR